LVIALPTIKGADDSTFAFLYFFESAVAYLVLSPR